MEGCCDDHQEVENLVVSKYGGKGVGKFEGVTNRTNGVEDSTEGDEPEGAGPELRVDFRHQYHGTPPQNNVGKGGNPPGRAANKDGDSHPAEGGSPNCVEGVGPDAGTKFDHQGGIGACNKHINHRAVEASQVGSNSRCPHGNVVERAYSQKKK